MKPPKVTIAGAGGEAMTTEKPSIESLRKTLGSVWAYLGDDEIAEFRAALDELEALRKSEPELIARAEKAEASLDALQTWYGDHEEREAACCPEDTRCTDYIGLLLDTLKMIDATTAALRAERDALAARVDDLAMLIRLLVHSIRKHSPDNETARKAMDYLRRHELQGSPLRTTILSPAPDAAKPNNQQEQP